jgi:hypothetical protein
VSGRATARRTLTWAALALLGAGCAGATPDAPDYRGIPQWSSRAIPKPRRVPHGPRRQAHGRALCRLDDA